MEKYFNIRTQDCHLTTRSKNVLLANGITDIIDIVQVEDAQMLKWRNCGEKSFKEIRRLRRIINSLHEDILNLVLNNSNKK